MKEKILQAIKEDTLYDCVANNYYQMSKEELKDLVLELAYHIYKNGTTMYDAIWEDLIDRWGAYGELEDRNLEMDLPF